MSDKPYLTGRAYLFKISKGDDLLAALEDFCTENQIKCGTITGMGSMMTCAYGVFDPRKKVFLKKKCEEYTEVLSLTGNISLKEDRPMVHAHIVLGKPGGAVEGGHLLAGTKVFVSEVFIQELIGSPKTRKLDKSTGLCLWVETKG
ncbi:MAG: DNA-binding protein [Elusimicrobiaceae bacterium]|nr:DNA-binding protein [Elusimicrobiaceae bacterium]